MEGDFKRPPRQPNSLAGGRPQPQSSQRPFPVTDLRPPAQQNPVAQQPTAPQPAPVPVPATPVNQPEATRPAPTTAELIAEHERKSKPNKDSKRSLVLAIIGLIVLVAISLMFVHHAPAKRKGPLPVSIDASQITIPVYYPKNLPVGFKVSGAKVVKQDNLNYVVTDPNNESFYVNIESIPPGYDFTAFNKRFVSPVSYQTSIGTATAGLMNNELICSIQTAKSWVLINSTAIKSAADMETIAKALKPASL